MTSPASGPQVGAKTAWGILDNGGKAFAGEYRVTESGVTVSAGPVLFAIDSKDVRYLLCPVPADITPEEDQRSAGVQLVLRTLSDGGAQHRFVALLCLRPRLTEVFATLADEVLARLATAQKRPDAVCRQVLDDWRELLERELNQGLSLEKRVGLFGELWVLRQVAAISHKAVNCWVGPTGARHDFMIADLALEIKASSSRRGRFAEIHGVDQLEPYPGTELYLCFVRLERVPAGGQSIPDVVGEILASGVSSSELWKRLWLVGYDETQADQEAAERFRVVEERYYLVGPEFPRIIPASFVGERAPSGVTKLTYEIDLSLDRPQAIERPRVEEIHSRLAFGSPA